MRKKITKILAIISISIFTLISLCLAERDSNSDEENRIRSKNKEYEAIIYYKYGEKIKTEYVEGGETRRQVFFKRCTKRSKRIKGGQGSICP